MLLIVKKGEPITNYGYVTDVFVGNNLKDLLQEW